MTQEFSLYRPLVLKNLHCWRICLYALECGSVTTVNMCVNTCTHAVFLKDELLRDVRDLWLLLLRRPHVSTVAPWTGPFRNIAHSITLVFSSPAWGSYFSSEGSVQSLKDALKPDQAVVLELPRLACLVWLLLHTHHDCIASRWLSKPDSAVCGWLTTPPLSNTER